MVGRAPVGSLAVLMALLPCAVVLGFDGLEGFADRLGIEGGPPALVFVMVLFVAAWVPGSVALSSWSARPQFEGVLAGGLVAACMAFVLSRISAERGDWLVLGFLLPVFGGLALGLGAGAGAWAAGRVAKSH